MDETQNIPETATEREPLDTLFKNPLAVFDYLTSSNYKISKAVLYRHVSAGKLRPKKTGQFGIREVNKYAAMYLKMRDGSTTAMASTQDTTHYEDLQRRKLEAEVSKANAQAEHWQRRNLDLDAEVNTRVGQKLAQQSIVLKADLRNFSYSKSPTIIDLVEGNPDKTVDLIAWLNEIFDQHLARYAGETR